MTNVTTYITNAINVSSKPQYQIAKEAGFPKPNVLSMIKAGQTRVPLARVKSLAVALDLDARDLLQRCVQEYHPEIWQVIVDIFESEPPCPTS
jgi:hypothetical protein